MYLALRGLGLVGLLLIALEYIQPRIGWPKKDTDQSTDPGIRVYLLGGCLILLAYSVYFQMQTGVINGQARWCLLHMGAIVTTPDSLKFEETCVQLIEKINGWGFVTGIGTQLVSLILAIRFSGIYRGYKQPVLSLIFGGIFLATDILQVSSFVSFSNSVMHTGWCSGTSIAVLSEIFNQLLFVLLSAVAVAGFVTDRILSLLLDLLPAGNRVGPLLEIPLNSLGSLPSTLKILIPSALFLVAIAFTSLQMFYFSSHRPLKGILPIEFENILSLEVLREMRRYLNADYPSDVEFDRSGELLAMAYTDGQIHIVSPFDNSTVVRIDGKSASGLEVLSFASSGNAIAFQTFDFDTFDRTIVLWDILENRPIASMTSDKLNAAPPSIELSPDGRTIAYNADDGIHLWEYGTGIDKVIYPNFSACHDIDFSPDGASLAINCGDVFVWDFASQSLISLPDIPYFHPTKIAFSPDGKLLAVGCAIDCTALIWSTENWELSTILENPDCRDIPEGTESLAFIAGGEFIVTAMYDGTLGLWRLPYGVWVKSYYGDDTPLVEVAASPSENLLVTRSVGGDVQFWGTTGLNFDR